MTWLSPRRASAPLFALLLGACQLINPEFDGETLGAESGSESESDTKPNTESGETDATSDTDASSDTDSTEPDPTDTDPSDSDSDSESDSGDGDGDTSGASTSTTSGGTETDGGDGDGDPFETDTDPTDPPVDTDEPPDTDTGADVICDLIDTPTECEMEGCISAWTDYIDVFQGIEWCYGEEGWIGCFDDFSCQPPSEPFYCSPGNNMEPPLHWVSFYNCKDPFLIAEWELQPCEMGPPGIMVECAP